MEKLENGKIVAGGAGGFLNPPTHPEHNFHMETDLRRRPENRGFMSLSSAKDCEYLNRESRQAARKLLSSWVRPDIESEEVKNWIYQVLGYFRGCYQGNPELGEASWDVSNLRMNLPPEERVEMRIDQSAGVHFIRKFYPEYEPTEEDFQRAYWGTKPEESVESETETDGILPWSSLFLESKKE